MESEPNKTHSNNAQSIKIVLVIVAFFVVVYFILSSGMDETASQNQTANTDQNGTGQQSAVVSQSPESTPKRDVFVPGDEVFLRYDDKPDEKIYIVDTLENYKILKNSYDIKDNEARYELIMNGNVIAVDGGTKVRILDFVDVSGGEKVRVLEGKDYNFTGYVPWPLMKKN